MLNMSVPIITEIISRPCVTDTITNEATDLVIPPVQTLKPLLASRKRKRSCSTKALPILKHTPKTLPKKRQKRETLYKYYNVPRLQLPYKINKQLEIFETPGKGRGIRTTIPNIPAGMLLLIEIPMIKELPLYPIKTHTTRLRTHLSSLCPKDHGLFIQLSSHHGGRHTDSEKSRFKANAMSTTDDLNKEAWNLYHYISFLNHSCHPNASYRIVSFEDAKMEVRTLVDIPLAGTEVTIDYFPDFSDQPRKLLLEPLRTVARRRSLLCERWGFICQCEGCVEPGTDEARERVNELNSRFLGKDIWLDDFVQFQETFRTYIDLLKSLGLLAKVPAVCRYVIKKCKQEFTDRDTDEYREWVAGVYHEISEATRVFFGAGSQENLKANKEYKNYTLKRKRGKGISGLRNEESGRKFMPSVCSVERDMRKLSIEVPLHPFDLIVGRELND
jgi:hypothetical protein